MKDFKKEGMKKARKERLQQTQRRCRKDRKTEKKERHKNIIIERQKSCSISVYHLKDAMKRKSKNNILKEIYFSAQTFFIVGLGAHDIKLLFVLPATV